jgi:hypothetical protein
MHPRTRKNADAFGLGSLLERLTLRERTERPITITEGTNRLAPWPLRREGLLDACRAAIAGGHRLKGRRATRPAGLILSP